MLHQSSPLLACMVTLFLYGKFLFFVLEGDIRNTPDCPGRNNSHFALENEDSKCPLSFQYGILPSSLCFEARSLCVVCGLLAMFRKKLEVTAFRSFNLSSENHAVPAGRRNKMLEWRLATLNASSPIGFFLEGDVRNTFDCRGRQFTPVPWIGRVVPCFRGNESDNLSVHGSTCTNIRVLSLEPSLAHYLLSSAPVPSYNMLGILSKNSPEKNALHHMHRFFIDLTFLAKLLKFHDSQSIAH